ncbi:MAG: hypothetical protein Q8Q85_04695, partial [Gemmatimonadales bacterium]|nr:hypothetical protein [Gemmatimonadales bacterium]
GALARDVEHMQRTLILGGATVLTFTLPDLTPVLPLARPIAGRIRLLNETLRSVSASTGAVLVDLAAHPVASDPRLWSPDRLHANTVGHTRIAAALAHALGLPGTDDAWAQPLPPVAPPTTRERIAAEIQWGRRYFLPWAWGHVRGGSSSDGRGPKRPNLEPL